jgi:hypothetical protein
MTDLKTPKKFLGIEITRTDNFIFINQQSFIIKMLEKFNLQNCNPTRTPSITQEGEQKAKRRKLNDSELDISKIPFRQAVGSLLYLANCTRPDITFIVNRISRKQDKYEYCDWLEIKKVFRYLKGTLDLGIKYKGEGEEIECFVDASLGTSDVEGKSTTGLVLRLFGDPILWRTKRQTHVSLSTAEAEYIAMSFGAKELVCIREMCKRLIKLNKIPVMYEDNTAAINIAKSEDSQSLKHIVNLCYHYIRLEVAKKNLKIEWINTEEQLADMFTKPLGVTKFEMFRDKFLESL